MDSKSIKLFSIKLGKELKDNDKPPSNVEELFVLNILEYKDRKFTSEQIANAKKGYYELTQEDVFAIEYNVSLFWSYMHNNTGIKDMIAIREAVGKGENEVKDKKVGYKMFFPSKVGLDIVSVKYNNNVKETLNSKYINVLKSMGLYANYLANSIIITELVITSMSRTEDEQAEIVYQDALDHPDGQGALYKGNTGNVARKYIKEGLSKEQVLKKIKTEGIQVNPAGFKHVSNTGNVIDIGAGGHRQTVHPKFKESFITFKQNNKFLSNDNSIPLGEEGEVDAYHTVFK